MVEERQCAEIMNSAMQIRRAKLVASASNKIIGISALLKLPNEVLQLVAFRLIDDDQSLCFTKNSHRDLSSLGNTCRRMNLIITSVFYHTVKLQFEGDNKYDTHKRTKLLWRTFCARPKLCRYVRTMCLPQAINWNWSALLSLLPNIQNLRIPSGTVRTLQEVKLPSLSSFSYLKSYSDPETEFPWKILFQSSIRHWRYCLSYDHPSGGSLLRPPPLPLNCVARSSPLTHIELFIRTYAAIGVLEELLNWPKALLSFSFDVGLGMIGIADLSRAMAIHRTSLRHLRIPWFPSSSDHPLGVLDLKRFERLEDLGLGWWGVRRYSPAMVVQHLPPSLIELTLLHTSKQGGPSWLDIGHQEWLIELSKVLKENIPSLRFLKLSKNRIQWMINQELCKVIKPVEDAWNDVGVIVVWIE